MANPIVTFEMENGDIMKAELYPEIAPNTVRNFVSLVNKGYYDGLIFHRVIRGFMIQGGCPNTRGYSEEEVARNMPGAGFGTGNPGYSIHEEFTTNPHNEHKDGTLAMARSQNPNSAGSQFYFCLGAQPMLDSGYTVFGDTIEGKDVIDSLRAGDLIESVVIENVAH